jgi:hypothetical protein
MKETVYVGRFKAIDLDQWQLSSTITHQARCRKIKFAKINCPRCRMALGIPLQNFRLKMDGSIISYGLLNCARSSKVHEYFGGCGLSFHVMKLRPIPRRRKQILMLRDGLATVGS